MVPEYRYKVLKNSPEKVDVYYESGVKLFKAHLLLEYNDLCKKTKRCRHVRYGSAHSNLIWKTIRNPNPHLYYFPLIETHNVGYKYNVQVWSPKMYCTFHYWLTNKWWHVEKLVIFTIERDMLKYSDNMTVNNLWKIYRRKWQEGERKLYWKDSLLKYARDVPGKGVVLRLAFKMENSPLFKYTDLEFSKTSPV